MPENEPKDVDAGLAAFRDAREKELIDAQTRDVPGYPGLTMRDLANALVAMTFRNGYLEALHAGKHSPLLDDPSLSRITDAEMRKLMIETSAQLALALQRFLEDPMAFLAWLEFARRYTKNWERENVHG